MFQLNASQLEAIGFSYIVARLQVYSPYGAQWVKNISPIPHREGVLLSLRQIEQSLSFMARKPLEIDLINEQLMWFNHIKGSIVKCDTFTLSMVELFEIKQFLLTYEKLHHLLIKLGEGWEGITFPPMDEALAILDAQGLRLSAFSLDSPALRKIREEKINAEKIKDDQARAKARNQAIEAEVAEEHRLLMSLTLTLRLFIPVFMEAFTAIGALDFTLAKARLAKETQATRPTLSIENKLWLKNMCNPYYEEIFAKRGASMQRIDLQLKKGTTIITGANMGGKSVALKTAVLNVVLCQMGFYVFATAAQLPFFDDLYFISEDKQDVAGGLSSFGAEIMTLKKIVDETKQKNMFIVLDEFARGTNPTEGVAIVKGVAHYLHQQPCISVITTHYDGVLSPGIPHYQVAGLNMAKVTPTQVKNKNISSIEANMDYSLMEVTHATPPPQNARVICQILGLQTDILELFDGI